MRLLQLTCFLSKLFIFIYVLFISLSPSPSLSPLSHISFIVLCYFSFCCFSSSFMPDFVMAVAPFFSAEIIAARPNMLTLWGSPHSAAICCVRVCMCDSLRRCVCGRVCGSRKLCRWHFKKPKHFCLQMKCALCGRCWTFAVPLLKIKCVREKGNRRRDRERLPHASHLLAVAQLLLVSIYKWLLSWQQLVN